MSASPAARPPTRPGRLFLVALVAVTALGPLAMQIFVPALPFIQSGFGVPAGTAQLALSLSMASIALSTLAYGPLSDRYGRRPVLIVGLGVFLLGSLLCAVAPNVELLILGRVVQAAGGTAGMVLARAMVRDVYAQERVASVIAYITIAMVVAPMFAPAIGGLLTDLYGWRSNFLFVALVGVGVIALVVLRLAETHTRPPSHPGVAGMLEGFALLLRSPVFCGYAFAGAFGLSAFFSFISAAPYLMAQSLGRPAAEYGVWFIAISIAFMAGNGVTARLSPRLGIDRMIVVGCAVGLAGIALMASLALMGAFSPWSIFGPTVIIIFGNGLAMANLQAGALGVFPHSAGTASGLSGFLQMAIAACFAQAVGTLQDGTPWPMIGFMSAALILALASFLVSLRTRGRTVAEEA